MTEDPGLTRHHRQLLQRLAAGDPRSPLAEMARDLLAGRTTPRAVIASGIYDEALGHGGLSAAAWYVNTSAKDRDAALALGQDTLARLADQERAGAPDDPLSLPTNPADPHVHNPHPPQPDEEEDEDFSQLDPLRP